MLEIKMGRVGAIPQCINVDIIKSKWRALIRDIFHFDGDIFSSSALIDWITYPPCPIHHSRWRKKLLKIVLLIFLNLKVTTLLQAWNVVMLSLTRWWFERALSRVVYTFGIGPSWYTWGQSILISDTDQDDNFCRSMLMIHMGQSIVNMIYMDQSILILYQR